MNRKLRTVLLIVLGVFLLLVVLGAVSSSLQRKTVTTTPVSTTTATRYTPTALPTTITITETLTKTVIETVRETTTITKTETLAKIATITPTTTTALNITQVIEVGLNQSVTFDNLEMIAYDVRVGPYIYHMNTNDFHEPKYGYKFVVIDLKFKNIGSKGMILCDANIWNVVLITDANKEYTEDHYLFNTYQVSKVTEEVLSQAIPVELKDWCLTWIDVGISTEFPLVFEIPVDEKPTKLILYVGEIFYRVGVTPKYKIVVLLE